jgi:hypothetical protein
MTDENAQAGTLDERKDIGTEPSDIVSYWLSQEKLAEDDQRDWRKRAHKIVKRYRDESRKGSGSKFNVLWANIQVLEPVLYARTPKPDIAPRWVDTDESVVRLAATILERSLTYLCDRYDIDSVMSSCVEDRLLPGMGIARVVYEPSFGDPVPDPDADEPEEGVEPATYRPVEKEVIRWEYKFWDDVAWGPARRWEEVPWLRFKSYMTRKQLIDRFGSEIGRAVPLDYTPKGMEKESMPPDLFKKATVLEFWDKCEKKAVWIALEYPDKPLDTKDDPLELDGFWPCPKPLLATTTNDRMLPVPDFVQYQDQADSLDILQGRIDKLTRALRVAGVYAASEKASLQQLLDTEGDNKLIPIEDWAMFAQQKGGLEGTILWLPIKDIADVLDRLSIQFDKSLQRLYEISGLSDIMRGSTDPNETLGAQQLKSQYGSVRVRNSQKDVGRFARDLFRLAAQVVSKHLDPKTISEITGLPELPKPVPQPQMPPQMAMEAMGAVQPGVGQTAAPAAPEAQNIQPQVAPAPAQQPPLPAGLAASQPGAGATPANASGATPPAPSDPMAKYRADLAAFTAYQQEVEQKTQEFAAACELLKEDALRTFRLDIEADSTIAPDEDAEKKARVEFVEAIGALLQQAIPFVTQMPKAGGALIAEILKFVVHGFRAGRPLEETIDKFADYLDDLPPPSPHTDPALIKVQADAAIAAQRLQSDTQIATTKQEAENQREQTRLMSEQQRIQAEMAMKAEQAKADAAIELAKIQATKEVDIHRANLEHSRARERMAAEDELERQKFDKTHAFEREKHAANMDLQREKAANDTKLQETTAA